MTIRRIGVLTGGGDAPGLNPAMKALVYKCHDLSIRVVGIYDGWRGLLDGLCDETLDLDPTMVRRWDSRGGTQLGSSRTNPFNVDHEDRSQEVVRNVARLGLDALVALGGEDTLGVANRLSQQGLPVVGIPKTIDRDLPGTDYTLGFDTALRTCADVIERSRTPAGSHHWIQVVEVMGRHAGHLALWSALAGGAQIALIPEHPFDIERVCALIEERMAAGERDRRKARYSIVVAAEGALPAGGHVFTVDGTTDAFGHRKLGGIGEWIASEVRERTPFESRAVALGHPQRGGAPSPTDRIMGFLFGTASAEAIAAGRFGTMVSAVGIHPTVSIRLVALDEVGKGLQLVDVARHYDVDRYFVRRSMSESPRP